MPLNRRPCQENPAPALLFAQGCTVRRDEARPVLFLGRRRGEPRLYGKVGHETGKAGQETFTPLSSSLSRMPVAASRISLSTLRFEAMASASGMEIILFPRSAAICPNSPRC